MLDDDQKTTRLTYTDFVNQMALPSYSSDAPIWWIWRNGTHAGRECFVAFDKEYPVAPDGGDPLTLGEPVFSGSGPAVRAWKPEADIAFYRARGRNAR